MRIKLLPTPAKQIAKDILSGVLPPETYDNEVVAWLSKLDPELEVYRIDGFSTNGGGDRRQVEIEFSANQIKIALENGIAMRPIA